MPPCPGAVPRHRSDSGSAESCGSASPGTRPSGFITRTTCRPWCARGPSWSPLVPAMTGAASGGRALHRRRLPRVPHARTGGQRPMRASIADFIECGGPAYAECGGLMYLARQLRWGEETRAMCGVLDADVAMHHRPQGRGYTICARPGLPLAARRDASPRHQGARIPPLGHRRPQSSLGLCLRVLRGTGIDGAHDGIIHKNLLASYAHLRPSVAWVGPADSSPMCAPVGGTERPWGSPTEVDAIPRHVGRPWVEWRAGSSARKRVYQVCSE